MLPEPPDPATLDPLIVELPPDTLLFRVHAISRGPLEFNPGVGRPSRFAPLRGGAIPTLYLATPLDGALSESVFHDVPVRGPGKQVLVSRLDGIAVSGIGPRRAIRLAEIAGPGLSRIGVTRSELIDTGPVVYERTAPWAEVIHDSPSTPEGLVWRARHDERALAMVLFGDRVTSADLAILVPPMALWFGPGLELVEAGAIAAGIAVVR